MQVSSSIDRIGIHPLVRSVGLAVIFAALVSLGGYLRIPIPGNPVPVTLQVSFVMLAGAFLPPALATASMVLFVAAGLAGLPVFSGGGAGLLYLLDRPEVMSSGSSGERRCAPSSLVIAGIHSHAWSPECWQVS